MAKKTKGRDLNNLHTLSQLNTFLRLLIYFSAPKRAVFYSLFRSSSLCASYPGFPSSANIFFL